MIDVHYFASIRESLGREHDQLAAGTDTATVAALMDKLVAMHGAKWDSILRQGRVLMAVNQIVARPDTAIRDGDEVAFFPPVTGG
jgi:molybdopterin synthase sulfur carrier subunit